MEQKYQLRMSLVRLSVCGVVLGALLFGVGTDLGQKQTDGSTLESDSLGLVNSAAYNVSSCLFAIVALSINGTAVELIIVLSLLFLIN